MRTTHVLFIIVAAIIVVGLIAFRPKSGERTTAAKPKPGSENAERPKTIASADAPAQAAKPVDVFFLSETDSAYATRKKSDAAPTMRQPVVNGTRRVGPSRPLTSKAEGEFIAPKWSPDGLELMFSKPGYNGLFTRGLQGGPMTQVTDKEGVGFRSDFNEKGEIATVTNTGEKQTFGPDGMPVDSVSIEHDSSRTGTFTKDDTVYYRAKPGEPAQPLTQGDDRYYGGVVSPDGKYVVYNGLHTGLYVQPLDGSAPPVSLGEGYSPTWLPDSSGVVYNIAQDDGHNLIGSDLFLASVDGQTVSNLTQTPGQIELNATVSPDGGQVAYEADGQIYIAPLF